MDIRCTHPVFLGGPLMVDGVQLQIPADGILLGVAEELGAAMLALGFFERIDAPAEPPKKAATKASAAKSKSKSKKTEDAPKKKASVLSRMSRALSGEDEE